MEVAVDAVVASSESSAESALLLLEAGEVSLSSLLLVLPPLSSDRADRTL